jgi:hypothetical protein
MIVSLAGTLCAVILFTAFEGRRVSQARIRKLVALSGSETSEKERALTQNRLGRAHQDYEANVRLTWISVVGCVILIAVSLGVTYLIEQPDGQLDGTTAAYLPAVIGFGFIVGLGVSVVCLAHAFARASGAAAPGMQYRHSGWTRAVLAVIGTIGIIGLTAGAICYYVM